MQIKNIAQAIGAAVRGKSHAQEAQKTAVPTGAQVRRRQRAESRFYAKQERRARAAQIDRERRQRENGHIAEMKSRILAGDTTIERAVAGQPVQTVEVELDVSPAMQRNIERDLVARIRAQAVEQVRQVGTEPLGYQIDKMVQGKLVEMGLGHLAAGAGR